MKTRGQGPLDIAVIIMAMERLPRSSVNFLSAVVSSVGIALLVNLLTRGFIENIAVERITAAASFVLAAVVLLLWYRTQPSVHAVFRAARLVLIAQFFVFGVVGVVYALSNLVALF